MVKKSEAWKEIPCLEEVGGKEWQRGDYHRVYFNTDIMAQGIDLKLDFYKTGNISYAELKGEKISNNQAKKLINKMRNTKVWFDVADGEFSIKSGYGYPDINIEEIKEYPFNEIIDYIKKESIKKKKEGIC